ncbi:MAG: usg protein [Stappiaceae bacterium]
MSMDLKRQLDGYGLMLAEILYHLPDHPKILQSYVWQDYDMAPKFPELRKFLDFWGRELDADVHSVRYSHKSLISPGEWRAVNGEFNIH